MCITLEYMYFFLSVYVLYSISEKKNSARAECCTYIQTKNKCTKKNR